MKNILLIYHKEDNDGVFSASLITYYLISNHITDRDHLTLFGTEYNELRDVEKEVEIWCSKYDNIIMSDLSFNNVAIMEYLYQNLKDRLYWFDHHKPIINESKIRGFDKARGSRDTSKATILNVYDYFWGTHTNAPKLLRILDAYDNWYYQNCHIWVDNKELEPNDYVEINTAINNQYSVNFDKIYGLVECLMENKNLDFDEEIQLLNNEGKICFEYDKKIFTNSVNEFGSFDFTINGRPSVFVVMSRPSSSILFDKFKNDYKCGIVAKYQPNGRWGFSVYNLKTDYDSEFDIGAYLKENYGGGGHKGAGGCNISNDKFQEILKAKKL